MTPPLRRHARALLVAPRRARECYHAHFRVYNRPPCLSCPIWRSSPTLSTLPCPAEPCRRGQHRSHWSCAARPPSSTAFVGQRLIEVWRRGKFLVFQFERDRIAAQPDADRPARVGRTETKPLAEQRGGAHASARRGRWRRRVRAACPPGPGARIGCPGLAAASRCATATRPAWASSTCCRTGRAARGCRLGGAGAGRGRPGADSRRVAGADRRHNGELKNLLRNQEFVSGIGNAYSDEILWAARLAPFRTRARLRRGRGRRAVRGDARGAAWAIEQLRELVPPRLEVEQRKFLKVH